MKEPVFYILISLVCLNTNAQVTKQWDLIVDAYKHNSSNYSTNTIPIETAILSNTDIVVVTQNNTFIKVNNQGEIIWKKDFKPKDRKQYNSLRILADNYDNIFLIKDEFIEKYDVNGNLIWINDFSKILNKDDLQIRAFTIDSNNNIYVSADIFYTKSIIAFKINAQGKLIWKKKIKQDIPSWHYLIRCKEILYHNDNVYILQHHYDSQISIINKLNSKGKKKEKYIFDYTIKQIKVFNDFIFTVGNTGSIQNDSIKIKKFNNNFVLTDSINFKLPRNISYSKEATKYLSFAITKEEYEKRYVTSYRVSDFILDSDDNFYIVGANNGQWVLKLDNKGALLDNQSIFNKKYHNYDKRVMDQGQVISSIRYCKGNIILTGLSSETDYSKKLFINNINLFLKVLKPE